MRLYFVGQHIEDVTFEIQGIFTTKERARLACHNDDFWIVPINADEEFPIETTLDWECVEYPTKGIINDLD